MNEELKKQISTPNGNSNVEIPLKKIVYFINQSISIKNMFSTEPNWNYTRTERENITFDEVTILHTTHTKLAHCSYFRELVRDIMQCDHEDLSNITNEISKLIDERIDKIITILDFIKPIGADVGNPREEDFNSIIKNKEEIIEKLKQLQIILAKVIGIIPPTLEEAEAAAKKAEEKALAAKEAEAKAVAAEAKAVAAEEAEEKAKKDAVAAAEEAVDKSDKELEKLADRVLPVADKKEEAIQVAAKERKAAEDAKAVAEDAKAVAEEAKAVAEEAAEKVAEAIIKEVEKLVAAKVEKK